MSAAAADGAMRGFDASIAAVHAMIEELLSKGVLAERIIIGGFSQGAALALASATSK